jgi:hypothetical protein
MHNVNPSTNTLLTNNPRHIICQDLDEAFGQIMQPDVNLVVCPRVADTYISSFIQDLYTTSFRQLNLLVEKGLASEQVRDALATYLPVVSKGASRLIEDMAMLSERFIKLIECPEASQHLQIVENDACRKFHVDLYPIRLICTYDGPGTQWLPNHQVLREALGTTNEQIAKAPSKIEQMGTFCVGIMKGDRIHHASCGIVHRSPPIKSLGLKRFVMRLDG